MIENRPTTILIIDDEKEICEIISEYLLEEGYYCYSASNSTEALNKLERFHFDVALLDINLPGISGIKLLKQIRGRWKIAIVMMSAIKDVNIAVESVKLGAVDYIVKPFSFEQLIVSVRTALIKTSLLKQRIPYSPICDPWSQGKICTSFDVMDNIARGVEARVDQVDFHSTTVKYKTVEIARSLGLQENEIEEWEARQSSVQIEREKSIKASLKKLEKNPIAQVIFGLTRSIYQAPKSDGRGRR